MALRLVEYPEFFRQKLEANPTLRAAVDNSISVVAEMLQVSTLPFFPDYTGHGVQHLSGVLVIADKLIAERARPIFTPEDTAVQIFSALMHDLALHLSEAGFKSLLSHQKLGSDSTWRELWNDFLNEAKHWDDRKLVETFGADGAGAPLALVRNPLDHYENLTESDRKLIGEFIRRNHAELAYEFAVSGFIGAGGQRIQFGNFDSELRKLAGIVARSHGVRLRDGIQLLGKMSFNKLEHDDVHPVFLMGILRIADFLELGTDRASLIAFAYKDFKSPISNREWRTNQAFRRISWGNPDPESIDIPANPIDISSYLELRRWLAAIQSELDVTWAVFGEVYGSHQRFAPFGLTVRRVRSKIVDDPEAFVKTVSFVPKKVELRVAGPDVLKLFVEPLYGERPEIGIRELIQNAVDAVRERREYVERHSECGMLDQVRDTADVTVWLGDPDENGVAVLVVSDHGIGMTEETIANYFLVAGASFRRSIAWKKDFESEQGDSHLKSRVLRSGRFGIGVLAAFLLGEEVEVATRHITADRGIRFSMRLNVAPPALEMSPIQMNYETGIPAGTTITVKVTKVKKDPAGITGTNIFTNDNLWDWYCLDTPSILRLQGRGKRLLKQSTTVPAEESVLPRGWHKLPSSDYRTVHAYLHGTSTTYIPGLICNGINVHETGVGLLFPRNPTSIDWSQDLFPGQGVFTLRVPHFSVFDPDGNLPLNLQRTGLTNQELDFVTEAFAAQAKAALAIFLLHAPELPALTGEFEGSLREVFGFEQIVPTFFTAAGTGLLSRTSLRSAGIKNCLLINEEAFRGAWLSHVYRKYDALVVARWGYHGVSPLHALNKLNSWIASARVITRSTEEPIVAKPLRFRYKQFSVGDFHVWRSANCLPPLLSPEDVETVKSRFDEEGSKELRSANDFIAAELFFKELPADILRPEFSVNHYWNEIIGAPVVPFDIGTRQSELKHGYEALKDYIADFDQSGHTSD